MSITKKKYDDGSSEFALCELVNIGVLISEQ